VTSDIDRRPLLIRVLNPGVPWWTAVLCNVLTLVALVLLALDPFDNLIGRSRCSARPPWALYGTALVRRWNR
jgi:hypothetical protein